MVKPSPWTGVLMPSSSGPHVMNAEDAEIAIAAVAGQVDAVERGAARTAAVLPSDCPLIWKPHDLAPGRVQRAVQLHGFVGGVGQHLRCEPSGP